jgi:hypothetical protein
LLLVISRNASAFAAAAGLTMSIHLLLDCTHAGLAAIRAQHPELCFTAGVKECMAAVAAAYDPELTESAFIAWLESLRASIFS